MAEIKHGYSGAILASGESARLAAEAGKSDLRGADLCDADLRGADLRGADLSSADLRGADLRDADLRGADLRGADFRGADLCSADLRGAGLAYADLRGARLNWESHDLIAEVLRGAAGKDLERRKLAGLILVSRDWCWTDFLRQNDPLMEWALSVLRPLVRDGDLAPECLKAAKKAANG